MTTTMTTTMMAMMMVIIQRFKEMGDDTKFEKVARDWDGANTFTLQIPRS